MLFKPGEFFMMVSGGLAVSSIGFLLGIKITQMCVLIVYCYLGPPGLFVSTLTKAHTFVLGRCRLSIYRLYFFGVLAVLGMRSFTQIVPAIVVRVTIYVVNLVYRFSPCLHCIGNAVARIQHILYTHINRPFASVTCFLTCKFSVPCVKKPIRRKPFSVAVLPSEGSGFVAVGKKFKQEFLRGEQKKFRLSHGEPFEREVIERKVSAPGGCSGRLRPVGLDALCYHNS